MSHVVLLCYLALVWSSSSRRRSSTQTGRAQQELSSAQLSSAQASKIEQTNIEQRVTSARAAWPLWLSSFWFSLCGCLLRLCCQPALVHSHLRLRRGGKSLREPFGRMRRHLFLVETSCSKESKGSRNIYKSISRLLAVNAFPCLSFHRLVPLLLLLQTYTHTHTPRRRREGKRAGEQRENTRPLPPGQFSPGL